MRGDCGLFVKDGRPVGGFFGWSATPNVARIGLEQNCTVYGLLRWKLELADWWLTEPGLTSVRAVFCRVVRGRLRPLFDEELKPPPYEAGKRQKLMILDKEIK